MSQETQAEIIEKGLRRVRYVRHEGPWSEPQPMETSLLAFVYDIPYFGAYRWLTTSCQTES